MFTLFCSPKSFADPHINIIQTNAFKAWKLLTPEPEVLIFGNEPGTAEICQKSGFRHIPHIACNSSGTPLQSAIFKTAAGTATRPFLCYINSDIIIPQAALSAMQIIATSFIRKAFSPDEEIIQPFLAVTSRVDCNIISPLALGGSEGLEQFVKKAMDEGSVHPPSGSDLFFFPVKYSIPMPDFAIGRPCWDNWLIYYFRQQKLPVIDFSPYASLIHQNHDYRHIRGGDGKSFDGKEADENMTVLGSTRYLFTLFDCTHVMQKNGAMRKPLSVRYVIRRLRAVAAMHPMLWALVEICLKPLCQAVETMLRVGK